MLIRRMEERDVEAVAEIARANYEGVMAEHHSAEFLASFRAEATPQFFRERMSLNQVLVVEDAGEVVATGALANFSTPDEPHYAVSQFYVRADLHRRGIGRRLLARIVEAAREVGAEHLHAHSSRNAIPFYKHAGFVVDADQPSDAGEITWMTMPLGNMSCTGVIIEESLSNKDVLKELHIVSTQVEQVTPEHKTPWLKQWTIHTIDVPRGEAPAVAEKLSRSLDGNYWYADFMDDKTHYVIFPNKVFKVDRSQPDQYGPVVEHGLSLNIPAYQLDFSPAIEQWERPKSAP